MGSQGLREEWVQGVEVGMAGEGVVVSVGVFVLVAEGVVVKVAVGVMIVK
jgi:hypothetical protein